MMRNETRAPQGFSPRETGIVTDPTEIARMRAALERMMPDDLQWATFPSDGGFEALPPGETIIDFTTGKVLADDSGARRRQVSADSSVLKRAQSVLIYADNPVKVRVEPGVGVFALLPNLPVFGSGRKIEKIRLKSDVPYLLFAIFGTGPFAPTLTTPIMGQARVSDTTLTKRNAAGTADPWTDIVMTAETITDAGSYRVNQALFGDPILETLGISQKTWLVRNLGSISDVEVRVVGTLSVVDSAALALLNVLGFALDSDIHQTGTPTAQYVTVPLSADAGVTPGSVILESGIPWIECKLQARIPAATFASLGTRFLVEYFGTTNLR